MHSQAEPGNEKKKSVNYFSANMKDAQILSAERALHVLFDLTFYMQRV